MSEFGDRQRFEEEAQPEQEKILHIGGREFKIGDNVFVIRSSGKVEGDWRLKSFGTGFAVVEKNDSETGGVMRKPIPLADFEEWQRTIGLNEQTKKEERYAREFGKSNLPNPIRRKK